MGNTQRARPVLRAKIMTPPSNSFSLPSPGLFARGQAVLCFVHLRHSASGHPPPPPPGLSFKHRNVSAYYLASWRLSNSGRSEWACYMRAHSEAHNIYKAPIKDFSSGLILFIFIFLCFSVLSLRLFHSHRGPSHPPSGPHLTRLQNLFGFLHHQNLVRPYFLCIFSFVLVCRDDHLLDMAITD
jgi:hypothetical protein